MPFPTFDAFGGFINSLLPYSRRRRVAAGPMTLNDLNKGVKRIIDIYPANYAAEVRDNEEAFAELTAAQQQTTVAIIGGGMSGLCALYELTRCGLKPELFEASDRIGGRCFTEFFAGDAAAADPAEMGAMRFPDTAKLMWHYFRKTVPAAENPTFQPFPNPGVVATALNVEGNTTYWIADLAQRSFGLPSRVDRLGAEFDEVFIEDTTVTVDRPGSVVWTLENVDAVLAQEVLSPEDEERLQIYWAEIIDRFDKFSLEMYVRTRLQGVAPHFWTEADVRLFKAVGFGTGGLGGDFPTSMVDFIRYGLFVPHILYRWGPTYTSSGFAQSFLQLSLDLGLPLGNIHLNSPAFTVRRGDNSVASLQCTNGIDGPVITRNFNYIIVATSNPSMMQPGLLDEGNTATSTPPILVIDRPFASYGTDLSTPLTLYTKQVRESIRNVEFYPSTKIWAATEAAYLSNPAWPTVEDAAGASQPVRWILTDRLLGQTAIFPNAIGTRCSVLLTYQNGFDALRYHPLPLPIPDPSPSPSSNYALAANQLTLNYIGMSSNTIGVTGPQTDFGQLINNSFLQQGIAGNNTFKIEWHNEPYYQGAFRLLLAGQYNYNAILAFQYTAVNDKRSLPLAYRRVILAGESAFFLDGWIEGPLYAGVNAASAVLYGILFLSGETSKLRTANFVDPDFIWKFRNNNDVLPEFWDDSMN